jgi:hypothetical protein
MARTIYYQPPDVCYLFYLNTTILTPTFQSSAGEDIHSANPVKLTVNNELEDRISQSLT